MIPLEKCIDEIEFRFPGIASHPSIREEWQTIKTVVLAQQTTNSDYAAALRVIEDICSNEMVSSAVSVVRVINVRLNAAKAPHCA
jgi:hypothetical protein